MGPGTACTTYIGIMVCMHVGPCMGVLSTALEVVGIHRQDQDVGLHAGRGAFHGCGVVS